MARSPGLVVLKWLIVPAILAAIGYFLIAPRIGSKLKIPGLQHEQPTAQPGPTQTHTGTTAMSTQYPSPDVEVQVGSLAGRPNHSVRPHRKRKPKPVVDATAPVTDPVAPPTTTGGDTGGTGGGN